MLNLSLCRYLQYFLVILKLMLQNYKKILNNCSSLRIIGCGSWKMAVWNEIPSLLRWVIVVRISIQQILSLSLLVSKKHFFNIEQIYLQYYVQSVKLPYHLVGNQTTITIHKHHDYNETTTGLSKQSIIINSLLRNCIGPANN